MLNCYANDAYNVDIQSRVNVTRILQKGIVMKTNTRHTVELAYLVSSGIEVGEGHIEQVVLERVDGRWDCELQGFCWLVNNLFPQYMI